MRPAERIRFLYDVIKYDFLSLSLSGYRFNKDYKEEKPEVHRRRAAPL